MPTRHISNLLASGLTRQFAHMPVPLCPIRDQEATNEKYFNNHLIKYGRYSQQLGYGTANN